MTSSPDTAPNLDWRSVAASFSNVARVDEGLIFRCVTHGGTVWGSGISEKVVWWVVRQCAKKAAIDRVAPHDLRRKLLDQLRRQINERQQKEILRMFREGPGGFKGGLSAGNYSTIAGASPATTTRDLTRQFSRSVFDVSPSHDQGIGEQFFARKELTTISLRNATVRVLHLDR
jgi:hypothetical protein